MDKHILNGRYFDTIETTAANDQWFIGKSAVVAVKDGRAIEFDDDFKGNSFTIAGIVNGDEAAIISLADQSKLSIAASGVVVGAIDFAGTGSSIENAGHIVSPDVGIAAEGGGIKLANRGSIDAATIGVFADALRGDFVNSGSIWGDEKGLELHGDDGTNQRFINKGHTGGGMLAIEAQNANDTIVNSGTIIGNVELGYGDDVFDARHGVLKGKVEGGPGADMLITDNARVHLTEGASDGFDQVKSTVSYRLNANVERLELIGTKNINATGKGSLDSILGNAGDNVIKGLGGPDYLDGGKGNDRLIGGGGNDTFNFAAGQGKDEIVDFADGDTIYLHNWKAIGSFGELKGHAVNHGADVWISAGNDTLIIDHMHKAVLQTTDFQF